MDATNNGSNSSNNETSLEQRTRLFKQYVEPHLNLIFKLCINYTYVHADIEDNYNEVLINLFKYIHTYDEEKSIQTWLHIVTRRFVADMNRKNAKFKRNDDVSVFDLVDHTPEDGEVSESYMNEDNYEQYYNDDIQAALTEIKPIYREALLLQLAGYKLDEIMEISYKKGTLKTRNLETVKSRLFLAKKQLRDLLTRDGERRAD